MGPEAPAEGAAYVFHLLVAENQESFEEVGRDWPDLSSP